MRPFPSSELTLREDHTFYILLALPFLGAIPITIHVLINERTKDEWQALPLPVEIGSEFAAGLTAG